MFGEISVVEYYYGINTYNADECNFFLIQLLNGSGNLSNGFYTFQS